MHLLTVEATYKDGSRKVFTATFLVDNKEELTDELLVSYHNYRGHSKLLNGQSIRARSYVFIVPKEPVERIEFFLDGATQARQTERYAFYDMGGTDEKGRA